MYIPDKWQYPSWELGVSIETDSMVDIGDILVNIKALHEEGIGYAWGYEESPHKVSIHAAKPKFIAEQVFNRIYRKLANNTEVKDISILERINIFAENSYQKNT